MSAVETAYPRVEFLPRHYYLRSLQWVQRTAEARDLRHCFVGGAVTDLITPDTQIRSVDPGNRVISVADSALINPIRTDGTEKDIDLLGFTSDYDKFAEARAWFRIASHVKNPRVPFSHISLEGAQYPHFPKKGRLSQWVTRWVVDKDNQLNLNFGSVTQPISWESIAPWTINFEDIGLRLTTLFPEGHELCYHLRMPSGVKPKDIEPVAAWNGRNKLEILREFAQKVNELCKKQGYDFAPLYDPWREYILRLAETDDRFIRAQAAVVGTYWNTLGTDVAHGKIGVVAALSDRFY